MGSEGSGLISQPPAIEFAGPEDARLFFSGPPRRLTGSIPLINTAESRQNLRSLEVNGGDLMGSARTPLRDFPFTVRLSAGEQASVRGVIALDSRTPPGSYEIEVRIGSRNVPATVHVSEVVDLIAHPGSLTILAGSESSYTREVTVHNAGNIPLLSGTRCETPIFDSFDPVTSMLVGLHKSDRKSNETMVKAVLDEWAELQAGTLVITRDPLVLRPGQTEVVDLEFQLPPELKPLRHYKASLQLYNAVLNVEIYSSAKIASKKK
jgi:hypothetical protein